MCHRRRGSQSGHNFAKSGGRALLPEQRPGENGADECDHSRDRENRVEAGILRDAEISVEDLRRLLD